jgi:crotonobetainyl-CoA:carnitine CoA-transferase CaiB-like acyl-CoA transferase
MITEPDEPRGPLDGIKVVELGVWVAGPGAAGILADWGADVVKIEPPAGDPARGFQRMLGGDLDVNPVFELDNRGKRGIALDLSTERGVELADRLVSEADVFLTNVRPAALDRLGLGPDGALERHPQLVYALITGYGLDGPDAGRAAYDIAAYWARAGIAESLRAPGGPLPFQRGGMGDHTAAMTAAAMVSAALVGRARTGKGQLVSTSLLRQGAYTLGFDVNVALMWGRTLAIGSRETMHSPTLNNYTASDGRAFWIVGLEGERHWPALARAVERPDWLTDPRFTDPRAGRRARRHLRHPAARGVGRRVRRRARPVLEPGQHRRGPGGRRAVPRLRLRGAGARRDRRLADAGHAGRLRRPAAVPPLAGAAPG